MKKRLTRALSTILIVIQLLVLMPAIVSADIVISELSNYTPERPGIPFTAGETTGLDYASFNNFTDNPNIDDARNGDEREFLLGKKCKGNCDGGEYTNTLPAALEAGDTVRLSVYFHNNGKDPYNGVKGSSPDAQKVQVGVNFKDIRDPNNPKLIRPRGFIYADNNEYRINPNKITTVITDSKGNIIRTATDDMQILADTGLELEPIPGSAKLWMKTGKNSEFKKPVTAKTTITFDTEDPDTISVQVEPKVTSDKIWLHFNKLPGCFKYSGFAYFDAKVTKKEIPNECKLLNAEENLAKQTKIKGQVAHNLYIKELKFEQDIPADTMIQWVSAGKTSSADDGFYKLENKTFFKLGQTVALTKPGDEIYYVGLGPVEVTLKGGTTTICKDTLTFKPQPPIQIECKELQVNYDSTIMVGQYSVFKAKAKNTAGKLFNGRITYSVPEGYGTFSTQKPKNIPENTSQTVIEFDASEPIKIPEGGFCANQKTPPAMASPVDYKAADPVVENLGKYFDKATEPAKSEKPDPTKKAVPKVDTSVPKEDPDEKPLPDYLKSGLKQTGTNSVLSAANIMTDPAKKPFPGTGQSGDPTKSTQGSGIVEPLPQSSTTPATSTKDTSIAQPLTVSGSTISVAPGATVYFVPLKAGDKKIKISTECTNVAGCTRYFSIKEAPKEIPVVCKASALSTSQVTLKQTLEPVSCLQNNTYLFEHTFYEDTAKTKSISPDKVKVKWTTTDPNGKFYEITDSPFDFKFKPKTSPYIGGMVVGYEGGGKVDSVLYSINGKAVGTATQCKAKIEPCEVANKCALLEIASSPDAPLTGEDLERGPALLEVITKDLKGNPLPGSTKLKWSTTTNGTLAYEKVVPPETGNSLKDLLLPLSSTPITFRKPANEPVTDGTIKVKMADPTSPLYSPACEAEIPVVKKFVCEALAVVIKEHGTAKTITTLEASKVYEVTGDATFTSSQPVNGTIVYTIDPEVGRFIDAPQASPIILNLLALVTGNFEKEKVLNIAENLSQPITLANKLERQENEPVLLITFAQPGGKNFTDALRVQVKGVTSTVCDKSFSLVTAPLACESLNITTNGLFDQTVSSIIQLTGDFKNHNGTITVSTSHGSLALLPDILNFQQTMVISQQIVQSSNNTLALVYKPGQDVTSATDVTITAVANGAEAQCKDTLSAKGKTAEIKCIDLDITKPKSPWNTKDSQKQLFEIDVDTNPSGLEGIFWYHWKVSGKGTWQNDTQTLTEQGDQTQTLSGFNETTKVKVWASKEKDGPQIAQCSDEIDAEEGEDEEEEKPEIDKVVFPEDKASAADDFLNISNQIEYVTYTVIFKPGEAKSAEIKESWLKDATIKGLPSGDLEWLGMRINVIEGKDKKYTLLQDDSYTPSSNSKHDFADKKYTENAKLEIGAEEGDKDFDKSFEKKFHCEYNKSSLCIDTGNDFIDAIERFKQGKPLTFKNLEKDMTLLIKYQMKVKSKINDDTCKQLSVLNGCGEKYNNEVEMEAWKTAEPDGSSDFEDSAKAKVVVLCPFIIKRQGGDSFFHAELDIGIDISKCAEVEGDDGIDIKKKPETPPGVPKTGKDTIEQVQKVLTNPTHNVCRYSNSEGNLSGYDNVLKNFSSSICELEATVAEEWTEEYINKSIIANIDRISGSKEISATSLININKEKIYVKNGGNLELALTEDISGARTVIVRNGNLTITKNILYDKINPKDYQTPKNIPSAAFIVIDGNIVIDKDVTKLHGAFIAIDTTRQGKDKGKITSTGPTPKLLTIYGNLIGNVYNLFENRIGVGDPKKNEGSVTILFDQGILLNPPPGLGTLIDIYQLKSVN